MFAITTRNKLRSRRHAISMIWAWRLIRKQLARTHGMLAYTTGMSSLTEFYTLTLWEKEIDMTLFMVSDDHRDMMWNVRHWSDSFWSMRWNATRDEVGTWNGKSFAQDEVAAADKPQYVGPGYMQAHEVPEALRPYLSNIIRTNEPQTLGINAVIGRIPIKSLLDLHRLKHILKPWKTAPNTLRFELAVGLAECMLFVVWKDQGEGNSTAMMDALMLHFPDAWAMRFPATDFEMGHWDQLRIRELTAPEPDMIATK